ncbi:MAG TPA: hypothetical protein VMX15_06395 [Candidatus Heimdallarchaeota archaeon]|nr:hypothetical protein [Candidatus Heimdallarchaeota archaeon]
MRKQEYATVKQLAHFLEWAGAHEEALRKAATFAEDHLKASISVPLGLEEHKFDMFVLQAYYDAHNVKEPNNGY